MQEKAWYSDVLNSSQLSQSSMNLVAASVSVSVISAACLSVTRESIHTDNSNVNNAKKVLHNSGQWDAKEGLTLHWPKHTIYVCGSTQHLTKVSDFHSGNCIHR